MPDREMYERRRQKEIHKNLHNSFPNEMIWKPKVFDTTLAGVPTSVAIYETLIS